MKIVKDLVQNLSIQKLGGPLSFVNKAQTTILSAAVVLSISSGFSAILGLVKGRMLTSYFGVSDELGIFYTADKIPNLIYSVLVLGALSTVFIPVFTDLLHKDEDKAWETASSIIILGFIMFSVSSLIAIVFSSEIIQLISLGRFTRQEVLLGASLMRIMIVAQVILVLSSFVTSILQSFKYFMAPALAPILYNIGMIIGIVTLSERFGIYGPAYGVIIGAVLHLLIQFPLLSKIDFRFQVNKFFNRGTKEILMLMPPRVLSVVLNQLIGTISNSLAILVSTSSVVILKFSSQLQFFPVHLFGASVAAASLPVLSQQIGEKNEKRFKKIFITTLHQMIFLVMPASMLFIILRIPIVRIVYGTTNFPWEATVKTAYALAFFSISIFSQSVVYLCTRAFYAQKDTITPVKVSLVALILSTALSIYAIKGLNLGVWSIALAFSIATYLEMSLLLYFLNKKLGGFTFNELMVPFIKISYATIFMGMFIYIPLKILDQQVFDTTRTVHLLMLTGLVTAVGGLTYLFLTKTFNVEEIELFYKLMRRFKLKPPKPALPASVVADPNA